MLSRFVSDEVKLKPAEIVQALELIARDPSRIKAPIHNFYKYPACFPPSLVRHIISAFSEKGDTVLDPFVGGGTTAVEAILLGRAAVGIDINDLSIFSTRLKSLSLNREDVRLLDRWITRCAALKASPDNRFSEAEIAIFRDLPETLCALIRQIKRLADALVSSKARHFALGVLLTTARTLIDNRRHHPTNERFLEFLQLSYDEMLAESLRFNQAVPKSVSLSLIKGDTSSPAVLRKLQAIDRKISLLLTSPPYPGISVLYNRWQISGRRETNLPYWIINSQQDEPASYYTMGHPKTIAGEEKYFRTIKSAFGNVRNAIQRTTLVIQVVAFSDKRKQLYPYLDAMDEAGFSEIRNLTRRSYDGRLWRPVSNRKWYNNLQSEGPNREEVIFFHRPR